jgi:hypothetical protein
MEQGGMMKLRIFLMTLILAAFGTCAYGQIRPDEGEIITAIANEAGYTASKLVTEKKDDANNLIATMAYVTEGYTLPTETVNGLRKLADSKNNGLKELYATEILITAGIDISDKALDRAYRMAIGKLTDWPLTEEKHALAIEVLQAYRDKYLKRKAQ